MSNAISPLRFIVKRPHFLFAVVLTGLLIFAGAGAADGQVKKPPVKCTGANGLTAVEIAELLAAQNHARAEHKLAPLKWDCRLADMAQEWAKRGVFEHREDTSYGENMFVSALATEPVRSAVERWMLEKANWTNKTGTCATGKTCTHYTQIVWKTTTQVGCGINRNGAVKWKVLLVCNYNPAGNTPGPAY